MFNIDTLANMRKKIDSRIRTLVENCVKQKQRSLFVIVGDKGRDQVVNLHYMLSKSVVKARPSVLWCYKKELYLSRSGACITAARDLQPLSKMCCHFDQVVTHAIACMQSQEEAHAANQKNGPARSA